MDVDTVINGIDFFMYSYCYICSKGICHDVCHVIADWVLETSNNSLLEFNAVGFSLSPPKLT